MEREFADIGLVPKIVPLGDSAAVVRFASEMSEAANSAALGLAAALELDPISGVAEVVPSLVSVLVRYSPDQIDFWRLSGEIGLRLGVKDSGASTRTHQISVRFAGPDLAEVAERLGLTAEDFIEAHNRRPLRILTTGFAPGFVYCGFHPDSLTVPRRNMVRQLVPTGSVLFAAGQTAITATDVPTGWHVIGQTSFRNFDASSSPPTQLKAGDTVTFEALP